MKNMNIPMPNESTSVITASRMLTLVKFSRKFDLNISLKLCHKNSSNVLVI